MKKQKKLSTKWDLSELGKAYDDPAFQKDRKLHEKKVKAFSKKWKEDQSYLIKISSIKKALDEYNALSEMKDPEGIYLFLMRQVDSENHKLIAAEKKYIDWIQKLADEIRFFGLSLGKIEKKYQKIFIKDKSLFVYKHYLEGIFETAKYQLSEKEERILSLKSGVASGNWSSLVSEIFAQETAEVLVKSGSKRVMEVKTFNEIIANLQSNCKRVRNSSAKAMTEIFKKHAFIIEKEFNSILENKKINDELRGLKRPDEARILSDDVTPKIVDTLAETVTRYFSISREFYTLKAKLMGQEKLHYHERVAPTFKSRKEKEYSYEDSISIVEDTFKSFDDGFVQIFNNMVHTGKVDAYPRKGKRGGAFCMYHGKQEPVYIMLNHTGKANDIMTLAHEMGHAIHGTLAKKEIALNYDTPMFTAETASTFCEGITFERLIEQADEKEKLSLMIKKLGDFVSTIMRQIAAYNFEKEVHKTFREKGYLSVDEIGKIFKKHMSTYMGSSVLQDYDAENWWMYWSHFRSPFYVYSYASGLLMSNGMNALIKKDPKQWENVKNFFYTGASKSPKKIFKEMGIDIEDKKFWEDGLKEIQKLLRDTKKLAKKLGKII